MVGIIYGILIGVVNQTWVEVLGSTLGFAVAFCIYRFIFQPKRWKKGIEDLRQHGKAKYKRNPVTAYWVSEALTVLLGTLPFSVLAFFIRSFFR